jgi:hypothetical protein
MSVTPAASQPLNHYFTETSQKTISQLNRKALFLNIVEKVAWVAFIAIMAAVLTVYYSGIILTGGASALMVGLIFSTIPLTFAIPKFRNDINQYYAEIETEKKVEFELRNKISDWKTPEIKTFLQEQGLTPEEIPLEDLKQINPEEPFVALLPLIARFNYLKNVAIRTYREAQEALKKKVSLEKPLNPKDADYQKNLLEHFSIRLHTRQLEWQKIEFSAIPIAFEAAEILQIMNQPRHSGHLERIGVRTPKHYDGRMFDLKYEEKDECFVFNEPKKAPITFAEIEGAKLEPAFLRQRLYG